MCKRLKAVAMASLTLMLAACQTTKAEPTATVRGEITYRERIAVPPGAQLEVLLLDVSRADARRRRSAASRCPTSDSRPTLRNRVPTGADHRIALLCGTGPPDAPGPIALHHRPGLSGHHPRHPTEVQIVLKRVGARQRRARPGRTATNTVASAPRATPGVPKKASACGHGNSRRRKDSLRPKKPSEPIARGPSEESSARLDCHVVFTYSVSLRPSTRS